MKSLRFLIPRFFRAG